MIADVPVQRRAISDDVEVRTGIAPTDEVVVSGVLFYLTGLASVGNLSTLQFRPGALADTLTSTGGVSS